MKLFAQEIFVKTPGGISLGVSLEKIIEVDWTTFEGTS